MFSQETIERVKNETDIVGFISQYLPLKRSGVNYKGLCPFHNEKTPSFSVNQAKQVFHCFGCGAGGTVFTFVMKVERLTFPEAVRFLADRARIPIQETGGNVYEQKNYEEKQALYGLYEMAAVFYNEMLLSDPQGQVARDYLLKTRKFRIKDIEVFRLGFAPKQGKGLLEHLLKQDVGMDLLKKSGLLFKNQFQDNWLDTFRDRLLFPIYNAMGKVVAFGGRTMVEGGLPKYLNSPETPLYTKSEQLYGLFQAKEAIQKHQNVLLVEGYFDVLACHQAGFNWVVGTLGTALTEGQIRLLRRYTPNITMLYDGDDAGLTAAKRSGALLLEQGLRPRFVVLKEAKDPDELLKNFPPKVLEDKVRNAAPIVDFHLDLALEKNTAPVFEEKLKIMDLLFPFLLRTENLIEQRQYLKSIASKLKLPEDVLAEELARRTTVSHKERETRAPLSSDRRFSIEEELLVLLLQHPEYAVGVFATLTAEDFQSIECRKVARLLEKGVKESGKLDVSAILSTLEGEDIFLQRIAAGLVEENKYQNPEKAVQDFVAAFLERRRRILKAELKSKIDAAQKEGRQDDLSNLMNDFDRLFRTRN